MFTKLRDALSRGTACSPHRGRKVDKGTKQAACPVCPGGDCVDLGCVCPGHASQLWQFGAIGDFRSSVAKSPKFSRKWENLISLSKNSQILNVAIMTTVEHFK